ncbi:MAG TPA: hypothetical protein VEI58_08720 [Chthoniobacterales bacterium]|nr:hypothetical protein [Chthoniobacterales bacterium]
MNMNKLISTAVIVFAAVATVLFFASCAEMEATNTKSLLSQAGFHTVTPSTPLQKEVYAHLTANHVQRVTRGNKTIYAFKDEKAGIAYVGHEAEYQRYKNLCIQQRIEQDYYMAYSMDPYWSGRWYGAWGYRGMYW